ncbi:MAG: histidine--tRNA ligase [Candidatus Calescibacterium sp.]|nr:histidine--tRNA ligase [Candidatus Calescibacterium sp.]MDW8086706.1 histidine--tRNA ligase [Candidatus Calescibacterium sp.]
MQNITGTSDIFGEALEKFVFVENTARDYFSSLGFEEIRTPIIEYQEVFTKSLGDVSDIVMHQMYSFEDKDGSQVVLRPEGTAPAVRFYIKNLQYSKPRSKIFYIGPMFRREKPQKGRYRQFHQIGCEIFGFGSGESDSYLIYIADSFLKKLGVESIALVNSIGCRVCRPRYIEQLREYTYSKDLCPDCVRRREKNPLRVLDCKIDAEKLNDAPAISDYWCEDCKYNFDKVCKYLSDFSVKFRHETKLVRGLDYYTGLVFEFYHKDDMKSAILAGGRYDFLVEFMGGKPTPACGFAMGIERLINFIQMPSRAPRGGVFIAYTEDTREFAFWLFRSMKESKDLLRQKKVIDEKYVRIVEEFTKGRLEINLDPSRGLKSQFRQADSEGYKFIFIIGMEEVSGKFISVRDLEKSEQFQISLQDFRTFLQ